MHAQICVCVDVSVSLSRSLYVYTVRVYIRTCRPSNFVRVCVVQGCLLLGLFFLLRRRRCVQCRDDAAGRVWFLVQEAFSRRRTSESPHLGAFCEQTSAAPPSLYQSSAPLRWGTARCAILPVYLGRSACLDLYICLSGSVDRSTYLPSTRTAPLSSSVHVGTYASV